jgi:hypothetical protein
MPKQNRKTIVKKYVKGVVVVHVVNHKVTRVLEEKVDDMPDMPDMGGMEVADGIGIDIGIPAEDGEDMSMFMFMKRCSAASASWKETIGEDVDRSA